MMNNLRIGTIDHIHVNNPRIIVKIITVLVEAKTTIEVDVKNDNKIKDKKIPFRGFL